MYRFLLTSKWIGWFALAVLLAAACAGLGLWQMDRRNDAVAEIQRIQSNYDRAPVPFSEAGQYFADFDASRQWLPVTMEGTYDAGNQRIVRNRPLNGRPGYEVVVPLRLATGETVIINRGWLPIGNNEAGQPDTVPAAPSGQVTVTARIKPGEVTLNRGAPEGQLASIDLPAYQDELGYPVLTGAYGLMAAETPAASVNPVALPKPSIDEGPHLSYSMQWFAFGVLMFVGFGYAARQQAQLPWRDEDDDDMHQANPVPRRRPDRKHPDRKRRKPTSEEEEDAMLDAQGF
jgi:cytochrome oxidase assembly protein ShyY1